MTIPVNIIRKHRYGLRVQTVILYHKSGNEQKNTDPIAAVTKVYAVTVQVEYLRSAIVPRIL